MLASLPAQVDWYLTNYRAPTNLPTIALTCVSKKKDSFFNKLLTLREREWRQIRTAPRTKNQHNLGGQFIYQRAAP